MFDAFITDLTQLNASTILSISFLSSDKPISVHILSSSDESIWRCCSVNHSINCGHEIRNRASYYNLWARTTQLQVLASKLFAAVFLPNTPLSVQTSASPESDICFPTARIKVKAVCKLPSLNKRDLVASALVIINTVSLLDSFWQKMHRDLSHGINEPLVNGLLNFVAATSVVLSESVEGCSSFVNRPFAPFGIL